MIKIFHVFSLYISCILYVHLVLELYVMKWCRVTAYLIEHQYLSKLKNISKYTTEVYTFIDNFSLKKCEFQTNSYHKLHLCKNEENNKVNYHLSN